MKRDSPQSVYTELSERLRALGRSDARLIVTFPVPVPGNFSEAEVLGLLEKQGYTRLFRRIESKAANSNTKGANKAAKKTDPKKTDPKKTDKGRKVVSQDNPTVVLEMIQDRFRFDSIIGAHSSMRTIKFGGEEGRQVRYRAAGNPARDGSVRGAVNALLWRMRLPNDERQQQRGENEPRLAEARTLRRSVRPPGRERQRAGNSLQALVLCLLDIGRRWQRTTPE